MFFSEKEVASIVKLYGEVIQSYNALIQCSQAYNSTDKVDLLERRGEAVDVLAKIQNYRKKVHFTIKERINFRDPDFRELEDMCNTTIEAMTKEAAKRH